jgi:hypothetical protein
MTLAIHDELRHTHASLAAAVMAAAVGSDESVFVSFGVFGIDHDVSRAARIPPPAHGARHGKRYVGFTDHRNAGFVLTTIESA